MRRAIVRAAIALAIPAIVLAITTINGQLVEVTTFNTTTGLSYLNKAMCDAPTQASVQLQWTIDGSFLATDIVNVYASNKAPPTSGTDPGFCAESPSTADGTEAGLISSVSTPTAGTSTLSVTTQAILDKTKVGCTEGGTVYVCAHWKASDETKKGRANGTFRVQVVVPDVPTGVSVQPGNEKLVVRWNANDETPTAATRYEARAYTGTAATPVSTAGSTGTSATIEGLANGTTYDVRVVAFSIGGNPSDESAGVAGVPVPTAGFWDVYESSGGVEQGGCASGPGGVLALLGVASLLAFRRRKP